MKRILLVTLLAAAPVVLAQEHAPSTPAGHGAPAAKEAESTGHAAAGPGDPYLTWRFVNFAILGAGLGYLIFKSAPAFYRSRSAEIHKAIREATAAREAAEVRAAAIEKRMASLGAEIERLRTGSREEMAHEASRTRTETERLVSKVNAQAEQEIAAAVKHAKGELKAYAAHLALEMAEQRIRTQMTLPVQGALVDSFVHDLEQKHIRGEAH